MAAVEVCFLCGVGGLSLEFSDEGFGRVWVQNCRNVIRLNLLGLSLVVGGPAGSGTGAGSSSSTGSRCRVSREVARIHRSSVQSIVDLRELGLLLRFVYIYINNSISLSLSPSMCLGICFWFTYACTHIRLWLPLSCLKINMQSWLGYRPVS